VSGVKGRRPPDAAHNFILFADVLKKFFTSGFQNENKVATDMEMQMLNDIKTILANSRATLVEDSLGLIALFTLLVVGLHLSGAA
jgi:hypothetical protein